MTRKDIDIQDTREAVYFRDEGRCQKCGKTGNMNELQLAHLIPRTKTSLVINHFMNNHKILLTIKQAESILNHPLNLKLSCSVCNSSFLITNRYTDVVNLLDEIKVDIDKNYVKNFWMK